MTEFNSKKDILAYQSDIWKSCDIVRGHVKESNLPNLMMPFMALIMVESRLVREYQLIKDDLLQTQDDDEDLHEMILEEIQDNNRGYNSFVLENNKRLINVCESSVHFEQDFDRYLSAYDEETKMLLGVSDDSDQHFLNLRSNIKLLKSKGVLFHFVSAWAAIDLVEYDNSEITTLEEHIKRKWADISAETAGEQYTPDDLIALISDISMSYVNQGVKFDASLSLYDMTCGGGNMLYGVEDRLKPLLKDSHIQSYGQEINDQLYALAKIESRFRNGGEIVLGDTLLNDKLSHQDMDILVANPPYGVDFSSIYSDVTRDKFNRYHYFPAKSDGQLLFVQHAISKLKAHGKAIIVLNGSPMFSGDVNSGEAQTRKWLLDNDYVEAWVQLPQSEFFNTQITTYLWILNKDKPEARKDKILLIDASKQCVKLKKSKGKKTNELSQENRDWVVNAFEQFDDSSDDVKILSKYDFYYNKQQVSLIETNDNKQSVYDHFPKGKKANLETLVINNKKIDLGKYSADAEGLAQAKADTVHAMTQHVTITFTDKKVRHSAVQLADEYTPSVMLNDEDLGAGTIQVKVTLQKATAKRDASLKWAAEIKPIVTKDYEIIPYLPGEEANAEGIQSFIDQWVRKRYVLGENSVGAEVNFNKIFYKPVVLRSTTDIAFDIKAIDAELAELEGELWG